jgi:hypothetical protein
MLTIVEPAEGETVSTADVTIRGTAPANAEVKHEKTGTDASIRANSDGQWEYQLKLNKGKNTSNFFLQEAKEVKARLTVTYEEPPPSVQDVTKETFAVNGQEVACRREPTEAAEVVAQRSSGTVQAMDAILKKDGTWHREVAQQCWVRTDKGDTKLFDTVQAAETQASTIRRKSVTDYTSRLGPIAERYTTQMQNIGTLASNPLLLNPDWQKNFKSAMEDLKKTGADARKLNPPPCLAEAHATFVQAADLFDKAANLAIPGAANANTNQITLAAASLNEGNTTVQRATQQFQAAQATCPQ